MNYNEMELKDVIREYIKWQDHYWAIVERLYGFAKYTQKEKDEFEEARKQIRLRKKFLSGLDIICDGYRVYSVIRRPDKGGMVLVIEDREFHKAKSCPKDKESFVISRLSKGRFPKNSMKSRLHRPMGSSWDYNGVPYDCKLAHTGAKHREFMV